MSFIRYIYLPSSVFLLFFLVILTGCASVSELTANPVVSEAEKIVKSVSEKKAEFDNAANEYLLTLDQAHLQRMESLIDLVREDLELASAWHEQQRYYPKGISYYEWSYSKHAEELDRKVLCEMMVRLAELNMLYGDKLRAAQLFAEVVKTFDGDEFTGYRSLAKTRLQELDNQAKVTQETLRSAPPSLSCKRY